AFPDRRDLSWSTAGRSPASAQRVFRTRVVLHATNLEETFVGVLRRGRRRTGARPGGLSAPRFRVRVAHGAVVAPSARFHAHQLRSAHYGAGRGPVQA